MKKNSIPLSAQIAGAAVFVALLLGIVIFFVSVFDADKYKPPVKLDRNYDRSAMAEAMSPEAVSQRFGEIVSLGSRGPGQKGLSDTEALIAREFKEAGLEVYTQEVMVPYPLTDGGKGTLTIGGGEGAAVIDAWPFAPNYTQPVVTPAEGVEGKLFLVTEESVRAEKAFDDKIAVVDLAKPVFKELGLNPGQYAELGFKGVVVTDSEGLEKISWNSLYATMRVKGMPINLVRVATGPEILDHIGETANLKAVSRWVNARTHNVVGVLRAKQKSGNALVIPVTYDAASLLPDYAMGSAQALKLALQLQILKGVLPHRDALLRDVIFVAVTGQSQSALGTSRLLSTIGEYGKSDSMRIRIEADLEKNSETVRQLSEIKKYLSDPTFATAGHVAEVDAALKSMSPDTRKLFADRVSAVMRKSVFEQSEVLLRAEIDYKRNPDDLSSPEFIRFRDEKKRYDDINNMSALPLARALERPLAASPVFFDEDGKLVLLRDALASHIDWLIGYHAQREESIKADLALQELFASYANILVFTPQLQPAAPSASAADTSAEKVGYVVGTFSESSANTGEPANLFGQLVNDTIYTLGLEKDITLEKPTGGYSFNGIHGGGGFETNPWGVISLPSFTLVSPKNSALTSEHPFVQPAFTNLVSIKNSMQVAGEIVLAAGRGWGNFGRLPFVATYSIHGSVFASGVGNSVVPNYAVAGALVSSTDSKPFIFTDPYGAYSYPFLASPSTIWARAKPLESFFFGRGGQIEYVKDNGVSAQNIYNSRTMPTIDTPVNLILYRAAPVSILNIVNPQSMKAFTGIQFISSSGLAAFDSNCPYTGSAGMMDFLPPKEYFFLTLKAGAPGNDLVATTRAFCLGVLNNDKDKHYKPNPEEEIDGAGYLAWDTPIMRNITAEADASMAWLAKKRLDLQNRYGMADEMTLDLDKDANALVADDNANGSSRPLLSRLRDLRQSLSYLILNHPVILGSVSEAVWGILWYMGLLVPFIFFFEKLIFGFTDVRKQIMAEGAIFLVVFLLLRILHPAFHMIRSSAMILLGFVIIIIVASVTSVLSTKFQENLDAMRASQGIVKGAQGNTFGIVMTAFMLGLNNMHRRKVRTGLTCATLVLMTFVMICFTSVQSNILETERATGRAAYQGILVREKQFTPISASEVEALNASYGENYTVNVRQAHIGSLNRGSGNLNVPNFQITYGDGDKAVTRVVKAGLGFTPTEPLRDSIKMLTTNGWFTTEQAALTQAPYPVIIPDDVAEQLGIFPDDVNAGPVPVKLSGVEFYIWGIFKSSEFAGVTDVDGENLIPFDIEGISTPLLSNDYVLAEDTDPRVQPSDLVFALVNQLPCADDKMQRIVSAVVDMGNAPYSAARAEINAYLIQTGRDCNYGLDGTSFNGRRARARSMAGMADLIIPLIIAALTVLNTMKGSVYERKTEIFVYNAVGIAPRYIFFMFVAEALVYSVVGAVLGYILSQGTGRILTALNLTGGMNMNFTSVTTIYASLAIAVATLASTYFPARSAIEIAKPTDDAGWSLPEPADDDSITFTLPFTFTHYDRVAVLSFFYNYFENLGEGSSGAFFSGPPKLTLADETDPLADGAYIPRLEVQVWLKPFDLGVSQMITIDLPTDPDTKEYISKMRLVRLTGTRDAWVRLNKPMVALIRQHFLHWRAVPKETKVEYFAQAKKILEDSVLGGQA